MVKFGWIIKNDESIFIILIFSIKVLIGYIYKYINGWILLN